LVIAFLRSNIPIICDIVFLTINPNFTGGNTHD
jgi:hypothetical protein